MTEAQQRYLEAIDAWSRSHGYAPTIRELQQVLEVSTNAVWDMLQRLREKGLVAWEPGAARTLRAHVCVVRTGQVSQYAGDDPAP